MRNLILSLAFLTKCFGDSQLYPQQETFSFDTTASPEQTTIGEQIITENYTDLSTANTEDIETTTGSLDEFKTTENNQNFTLMSSEGPGQLNFTDIYPNEDDTNCFEIFISSWQGIDKGLRKVILNKPIDDFL